MLGEREHTKGFTTQGQEWVPWISWLDGAPVGRKILTNSSCLGDSGRSISSWLVNPSRPTAITCFFLGDLPNTSGRPHWCVRCATVARKPGMMRRPRDHQGTPHRLSKVAHTLGRPILTIDAFGRRRVPIVPTRGQRRPLLSRVPHSVKCLPKQILTKPRQLEQRDSGGSLLTV